MRARDSSLSVFLFLGYSPCVCAERRAAAALKQEKPGGEGGPSKSCFSAMMNRI